MPPWIVLVPGDPTSRPSEDSSSWGHGALDILNGRTHLTQILVYLRMLVPEPRDMDTQSCQIIAMTRFLYGKRNDHLRAAKA